MHVLLEEIYQSAIKFLIPLTREDTYSTIINEAVKLLDAEYGNLFIARDGILHMEYTTFPPEQQFLPRPNGYMYKTFHERKIFVVAAQQLKKERPDFNVATTQQLLTLPLFFDDETVGVMGFRLPQKRRFTKEKLKTIQLFGSFASLKIRNVELYEEAQRSIAARDVFLSMASHELKTPLTTISGYIQIIEKNVIEGKPIKKEWVEETKVQTKRLIELVNTLLNVEEMKEGRSSYQWQVYSLHQLITLAIAQTNKIFYSHNIRFVNNVSEIDDRVMGDEEKLIKVFTHILTNAAKFSLNQQEILVTLNLSSSFLTVTIQDEGVGISENDLKKIFDKYNKGENHSREGMGLGLYLSQQIIHDHHGTIKVHSKKNHGTTVEIQLPQVKS